MVSERPKCVRKAGHVSCGVLAFLDQLMLKVEPGVTKGTRLGATRLLFQPLTFWDRALGPRILVQDLAFESLGRCGVKTGSAP